jgi:hypothetical protein
MKPVLQMPAITYPTGNGSTKFSAKGQSSASACCPEEEQSQKEG